MPKKNAMGLDPVTWECPNSICPAPLAGLYNLQFNERRDLGATFIDAHKTIEALYRQQHNISVGGDYNDVFNLQRPHLTKTHLKRDLWCPSCSYKIVLCVPLNEPDQRVLFYQFGTEDRKVPCAHAQGNALRKRKNASKDNRFPNKHPSATDFGEDFDLSSHHWRQNGYTPMDTPHSQIFEPMEEDDEDEVGNDLSYLGKCNDTDSLLSFDQRTEAVDMLGQQMISTSVPPSSQLIRTIPTVSSSSSEPIGPPAESVGSQDRMQMLLDMTMQALANLGGNMQGGEMVKTGAMVQFNMPGSNVKNVVQFNFA